MSAARQAFGELGERIAERWLKRHGYRVVQRRFRFGHRDIDLVVERAGTVAFVEVKARRGVEFGDPIEAVNWSKQRELARSASVWIDRHGRPNDSYRFDVVGVLVEGDRGEFDTSPTPFRFHIRLEFGTRLSYFIRVSNRPLFRYDYAAWPERTTTNREDD
jgi:putative endonuclease